MPVIAPSRPTLVEKPRISESTLSLQALGVVGRELRTPPAKSLLRTRDSPLGQQILDFLGIPLIVNTSSGIMNTDSGHREHSPERSDGLASQFIPSESRFSLF